MSRTFILATGVECEVEAMITAHQRMVTEEKSGTGNERLNKLVESRVVRIGSVHFSQLTKEQRQAFVLDLVSEDKRLILANIRQYTLDDDLSMTFKYNYKSKQSGDDYGKKKVCDVEGRLTVETKRTYKQLTGDIDPVSHLPIVADMKAVEYKDVQKDFIVTLPKSGQRVKFTLLDGHAEKRASLLKTGDLSSNSPIEIRNPVYEVTTDKQGEKLKEPVWITLNIDKQQIRDTEYLRKVIDMIEGKVITDVTFEHPESNILDEDATLVTLDALGITAFFFPSGVI